MDITEEVKMCMEKCPDFLDFPTAWAMQNTMNEHIQHHPNCSSVPDWHPLSGPGMLCDCGGVNELYENIKNHDKRRIN